MMRESQTAILEDKLSALAMEGARMFADCTLDPKEARRLYQIFTYDLPLLTLEVSEIRLAQRVRARVDRVGLHKLVDRHIASELADITRRRREIEKKRPRASDIAEVAA